MALRNLKYYVSGIASNRNAAVLQQIQFEANAADPTDADLAVGRLHYKTSVGLRWYDGSTWYTIPTSSSGGGLNSWDDMYALDKTLTIDSTTLTLALTHATNDGLTITGSAGSAGDCIQITNLGSGNDIEGTSDLWSITKAGSAKLVGITGCDTIVAAANLALDATGAGTITLGATSTGAITLTRATACSAALTVGTTLTVGTGATFSDGLVDIIDNANDASTLRVTNDTQSTYGNASDAGMVVFRSESITTGALLHLSVDETGMAGGFFLRCWSQDAGAAAFTIGELGVTVITGAEGAGALTVTNGDVSFANGSLAITDNDNAAILDLTNDTVTTLGAAADAGLVDIDSESLSTGALVNLSLDETALTTGWYLRCYGQDAAANVFSIGEYGATVITTAAVATSLTITTASTNVDAVSIVGSALTTGDLVFLSSTAETLAAGELLKIDNTENGDASLTPKTGNLCSITSSVTQTTADATFDYDTLLISRSNISNNAGFTLTASGSVLKLMNTSTNTAGTCTDTTVILEILAVEGGTAAPTGDCAKITSVGVGARALNIVSASTTVSDVLITGSGVKADNKAYLQVGGNGATAAGGSQFRVASTGGTPAAATSYLVDFDYGSSTMTNNPITVYLNAGTSTGAALSITGSGAGYSLATYMTGTGATGVQWYAGHQAGSSENDNDVVFTLHMAGACETAHTAVTYAKIITTAIDVSDATEDGKLDLQVMVKGTVTSALYIQSSAANATSIADSMLCAIGATTFTGVASTTSLTLTNGNVLISAGNIVLTAGTIIETAQAILNANTAISITHGVTKIANNAASTHTLADGVEGQRKSIVCTVYTADAVITPANLANGTTITLNAVNDACDLVFLGAEWFVLNLYGTAALA